VQCLKERKSELEDREKQIEEQKRSCQEKIASFKEGLRKKQEECEDLSKLYRDYDEKVKKWQLERRGRAPPYPCLENPLDVQNRLRRKKEEKKTLIGAIARPGKGGEELQPRKETLVRSIASLEETVRKGQ
jgi:DNA repair exonuclease SbcCD ATPase subunit